VRQEQETSEDLMCAENEFVALRERVCGWLVVRRRIVGFWGGKRSRVLGFFCWFSVADLGFWGCCGGSNGRSDAFETVTMG